MNDTELLIWMSEHITAIERQNDDIFHVTFVDSLGREYQVRSWSIKSAVGMGAGMLSNLGDSAMPPRYPHADIAIGWVKR